MKKRKKKKAKIGNRIKIIGNHPNTVEEGIIEDTENNDGSGDVLVILDNGVRLCLKTHQYEILD